MSAVVEPVYSSKPSRSSRQRSESPPAYYEENHSRYRSRSPHDSSSKYEANYSHRSEGYRPGYYRGGGIERGAYRYSFRGRPSFSRRGYRGAPGGYDMRGGGRGRYYDNYNMNQRYPDFLNNILPEDDPHATRTLFIGNLDASMTESELKRVFGRYGTLVSVDIKMPAIGSAYAFVRYENLDQSYAAKVELSGQFFGSFQWRIGYGKLYPSPRVWVGGLGTWASVSLLEKEFDRFGAIDKIEYERGKTSAYILYASVHAAENAVHEMRGFPLGGSSNRLRMDFADTNDDNNARYRNAHDIGQYYAGSERGRSHHEHRSRSYSDESSPGRRRRAASSPRDRSEESDLESCDSIPSTQGHQKIMISEICSSKSSVWEGGLVLKNSVFPTKFHLIHGRKNFVDLMKDEQDRSIMKITQRLRLDQTKLDDVKTKMESSTAYAVFVATTADLDLKKELVDSECRQLKNLVSYLKQKDAAGVVSLASKKTDMTGVVYCFPPCQFSRELLEQDVSGISSWDQKSNHIVIVVF